MCRITARYRFAAIVAFMVGAISREAFATIVIDNPAFPAFGQAFTPSNVEVDQWKVPLARVIAFPCGGGGPVVREVHHEVDLVGVDGVSLPAGTWCSINLVTEGASTFVVDGSTWTEQISVIHLVEQAWGEGISLRLEGDQGALEAVIP